MKKSRPINRAAVLAALYELGAVDGKKRFPWADQTTIARRTTKTHGKKYTRLVGDILRDMEAENIVQCWRIGKVTWWRIKKRE